jgi:hypothetical protein
MARYVMILRRAISIARVIGRGWALEIETLNILAPPPPPHLYRSLDGTIKVENNFSLRKKNIVPGEDISNFYLNFNSS